MATSSVQNEESTKVGVPSEACKRTEPLDMFQMLLNDLILIEKLREGYRFNTIQYDVDKAAFNELMDILEDFKKRLKKLDDCENFVDKLDSSYSGFVSIENKKIKRVSNEYIHIELSDKEQSESFFKLREDNKKFQQLLEELKSLLKKKLSKFENAAYDGKNKKDISIIKQCLKDVFDLKSISRDIQYDHSTSVFIILEEFLALDDNLFAFWKSIDKDFTDENTEKALLQLQMSVKKKKEQLLEDSKKENVEDKTREDERKNLSKIEYFLECISKSFTEHPYVLVNCDAVWSMSKRWDFDMNDFYSDISNFEVFKRSVCQLRNKLSKYKYYFTCYPPSRRFPNIGSRRCNLQLHHWMRKVATHLEDYQKDLNKKLSNQQKSKDQTYNKSIEEIKNTLEKLKPLTRYLEEIKSIINEYTLLSIDLDKCLQFDDELLNYWNKLKESSNDYDDNLENFRSEIKKRKKRVLEERRIAEKISNLELSENNDDCQGKALEVVD